MVELEHFVHAGMQLHLFGGHRGSAHGGSAPPRSPAAALPPTDAAPALAPLPIGGGGEGFVLPPMAPGPAQLIPVPDGDDAPR